MSERLEPTVTVSAGSYATVRAVKEAKRLFGRDASVKGIVGGISGPTYTYRVDPGGPETTAGEFWEALGIQREWLTEPQIMYDEDELIWKMTAKEGFLFDDSFWEVFVQFPFKICHVSYSGAPWSHEGGPPEMVLRFGSVSGQ
jgi:hypothetical protein